MFDWKMWRWIITGVFTVLSIVFLVPTFVDKDDAGNPILPEWWVGNLPSSTINLGLDLQGGMHVDLEVGIDVALHNRLNQIGDTISRMVRDQNVTVRDFAVSDGVLAFTAEREVHAQIASVLTDRYPDLQTTEGPVGTAAFRFTSAAHNELSDMAVQQALETIRNRIDQFGVREPEVVRRGDDRIVVQLPGIQDPQRALDLIQSTAQLEFKLVNTDISQRNVQGWVDAAWAAEPELQTAPQAHENVVRLNEKLSRDLPPGMQVLFQRGQGGQWAPIVVQARPLMTGESVATARIQMDQQFGQPTVSLEFTADGATQFERVTSDNVGRQMAIVLDNVVQSAPRINERIAGGQAQITGAFTMDEARDLAISLRSGALPAPVDVVQQTVVGPTLGQDSIEAGIRSIILGGILVLIFMMLYYRFAGVVANVALILNVLFVLGVLSMFDATLTLPGIAGIILTIGMAIDANIIIFERMREEMRLGKTHRSALETGYGKAKWTIIDAQVTSLVAALVLFQFGTGPVKGFAVTLTIGILSSIFTAVVVSRMFFDLYIGRRGNKRIPVGITLPERAGTAGSAKVRN